RDGPGQVGRATVAATVYSDPWVGLQAGQGRLRPFGDNRPLGPGGEQSLDLAGLDGELADHHRPPAGQLQQHRAPEGHQRAPRAPTGAAWEGMARVSGGWRRSQDWRVSPAWRSAR